MFKVGNSYVSPVFSKYENSVTKMKTYFIKILQTYEETYLIETESEQNAIYLAASDRLKPEKSIHTKSDIKEVKEL